MDVGSGKIILYTLRDVSPTSIILTLREEAFCQLSKINYTHGFQSGRYISYLSSQHQGSIFQIHVSVKVLTLPYLHSRFDHWLCLQLWPRPVGASLCDVANQQHVAAAQRWWWRDNSVPPPCVRRPSGPAAFGPLVHGMQALLQSHECLLPPSTPPMCSHLQAIPHAQFQPPAVTLHRPNPINGQPLHSDLCAIHGLSVIASIIGNRFAPL